MLNKNVETFIGCDAEYENAKIVLYGAPFDSTTSFRPGTRFASAAIRQESCGLETYSPYQEEDLADYEVFDSGDMELCMGHPGKALEVVEERAKIILEDGKIPFLVGGEHLMSIGGIWAAADKYRDLCILHFDAHADLRKDYLGAELSHACVMRRCHELLGDGRIYQFGIRSGDRSEFEWSRLGKVSMHKFDFQGLEETLKKLEGKPVYFTVDLDVLDPSIFPGTGTPEAGGVSFQELSDAICMVCERLDIVGCDVMELCPAMDPAGVSTAVACKVIREFLLALLKKK